MTTLNAIKEMSKHGAVRQSGNFYSVTIGSDVVEVLDHHGVADCILVRGVNERDDPRSDYFAGTYFPSLRSAIRCALLTLPEVTA